VVAARCDVKQSRRSVPRQQNIRLRVAVVGEGVTLAVEIEIVGVAKTLRDDAVSRRIARRDPKQRAPLDRLIAQRPDRSPPPRQPRLVPHQDVERAIRPPADGMRAVFGEGQVHDAFRRSVRPVVTIGIPHPPQRPISDEVQIVSHETKAHAARRGLAKLDRAVRHAVLVRVDQRPNITAAGHHDLAARIDRHRVDVVRQPRVSIKVDGKTAGHPKPQLIRGQQLRRAGRRPGEKSQHDGQHDASEPKPSTQMAAMNEARSAGSRFGVHNQAAAT
jgi:hypothetical protein